MRARNKQRLKMKKDMKGPSPGRARDASGSQTDIMRGGQVTSENNGEESDDDLLTVEDSIDEEPEDGVEEGEKSKHEEGEGEGDPVFDAVQEDLSILTRKQEESLINCIRILRFLQLLCENHNNPLQNYLREQVMANGTVNGRSFNFIQYISIMLGVYEKSFVNRYSADLGY
jgi:hypothetical protein